MSKKKRQEPRIDRHAPEIDPTTFSDGLLDVLEGLEFFLDVAHDSSESTFTVEEYSCWRQKLNSFFNAGTCRGGTDFFAATHSRLIEERGTPPIMSFTKNYRGEIHSPNSWHEAGADLAWALWRLCSVVQLPFRFKDDGTSGVANECYWFCDVWNSDEAWSLVRKSERPTLAQLVAGIRLERGWLKPNRTNQGGRERIPKAFSNWHKKHPNASVEECQDASERFEGERITKANARKRIQRLRDSLGTQL